MNFKYALKWSFFSELVSKSIQPVIFIFLARLLTPTDFGVMTAAIMIIAFSQIFWEAGMGKAVIQLRNEIEIASNTAFWINMILATIIAILLFLFSNQIANVFFQDLRVAKVLKVMTLQLFLGALTSIHTALLQKEMLFKRLFLVRLISVILPGIASIPLALNGWGYWALVAGSLTSQLIQTIILWIIADWKPKFEFSYKIAYKLLVFGGWVALTGLLTWSWTWLDNMLVGYSFGLKEVGLFRMGNQIPLLIFGLLFSFASPVLYSRFSNTSINLEQVKADLKRIYLLIPAISFPIAILIIYNSNFIEKQILGPKWNGSGYIISAIAVKEAVLWLFAYNIEACRSIGKPHIETFVSFMSLIINILVLSLISKYGFEVFVYGRAYIVGLLSFILHFSVLLYSFGGWDKIYKTILLKVCLFLLVVLCYPLLITSNHNINFSISFLIAILMFLLFIRSSSDYKLIFNKVLKK
jgi:O-antigen/teichoic acid export membrane protein